MPRIAAGIRYAVATVTVACCVGAWVAPPSAAQVVSQERLEVAMTVQLLSFVDWPEPPDAPLVIGVFENPAQYAVFKELLEDPIYRGRYAARLVTSTDEDSLYEDLAALYFDAYEPRELPRVLKRLESRPVVLIGSFDGFLEMGGMVNLTRKQKRLGFEISLLSAREHNIEIRAKLLRLATRVLDE